MMLSNLKCHKEDKRFFDEEDFYLEKLLKHIFDQEFVTC